MNHPKTLASAASASRTKVSWRPHRGFTLLDLLIAISIVGILAGIALPSYTAYVDRARRAEGRTTMLDAAQFMQRFYAANNTYVGATLPTGLQRSPANGPQAYTIRVAAGVTATGYTLEAVPQGPMSGDDCGTLTITSTGVRGRTGSGETLERCWK